VSDEQLRLKRPKPFLNCFAEVLGDNHGLRAVLFFKRLSRARFSRWLSAPIIWAI